jgi:hypothetical protein
VSFLSGVGTADCAPVVVLTTSKTTTSRVLSVLSYTTITGGYMTTVLASFGEVGRHLQSKFQSAVILNIALQSIQSAI